LQDEFGMILLPILSPSVLPGEILELELIHRMRLHLLDDLVPRPTIRRPEPGQPALLLRHCGSFVPDPEDFLSRAAGISAGETLEKRTDGLGVFDVLRGTLTLMGSTVNAEQEP
jgi:hypothetical protein